MLARRSTQRSRTALAAALIAIMAAQGACSAPAPVATPGAPTGAAPPSLEPAARAARPAQLLGTGPEHRTTTLQLLGQARSVRVRVPRAPSDPSGHGMTWLRVTAGPGLDALASSTSAGQGGPAWRQALWTSAAVVAAMLNQDVADLAVTAEPDESMDGPAASGAVAAALLAALVGREPDPAAAVLGIVHPDGSLGAVSGLDSHVRAAAAAGTRRLGVATPAALIGEVAELAASLGVELVPLRDVRDAYRLLTGHALPRPVPLPAQDMAVAPVELAGVDRFFQTFRAHVIAHWAEVIELTGARKLPPPLERIASRAHAHATAAESLWRRGAHRALAADRMASAAILAMAAAASSAVLAPMRAGDTAAAGRALDRLAAWPDAGAAAVDAAASFVPRSLADHLRLVAALTSVLRSLELRALAVDDLGRARAILDEGAAGPRARLDSEAMAARLVPAAIALARSVIEAEAAALLLAAPSEHGPVLPLTDALARRLAAPYLAAAAANLDALDAALAGGPDQVHDDARDAWSRGQHHRVARLALAVAGASLPPALAVLERSPAARRALVLAAGLLAHAESSLAIAAWTSLGASERWQPGAGSLLESVDPARLDHLLALAERKAREHARAALVACGAVPLDARRAYQASRQSAAGDGLDALHALERAWSSSLLSQLAVALARHGFRDRMDEQDRQR